MRTRRGICYPREEAFVVGRKRDVAGFNLMYCRKRRRLSPETAESGADLIGDLPDDLLICILSKLISTARFPSDFINVLLTCKRLNGLGLNSLVLSKASPKMFAIKAKNWTESAHRFLKLCTDSGSVEACYTLGMIRFYCLQNRGNGASLMAKAAMRSHAPALYSLAVIQFNGSGGTKTDKDLRAGVALCARSAYLGHVDALRELGHCLQDGYGVPRNIAEGRRFLVQANARELAAVISSSGTISPPTRPWIACAERATGHYVRFMRCPLLSDFGCNVPAPEAHPANRFLSEWFGAAARDCGACDQHELRLCSHSACGRPETRKHEFRRCSVCGAANYCSRACQALDWKLRHKSECVPVERWLDVDGEMIFVIMEYTADPFQHFARRSIRSVLFPDARLEDRVSTVQQRSVDEIRQTVDCPADITWEVPNAGDDPFLPPPGRVAFNLTVLEFLELPLRPWVREALCFLNVSPYQLHPSSYLLLAAFRVLFSRLGILEPSVKLIARCCQPRASVSGGYFYLHQREWMLSDRLPKYYEWARRWVWVSGPWLSPEGRDLPPTERVSRGFAGGVTLKPPRFCAELEGHIEHVLQINWMLKSYELLLHPLELNDFGVRRINPLKPRVPHPEGRAWPALTDGRGENDGEAGEED